MDTPNSIHTSNTTNGQGKSWIYKYLSELTPEQIEIARSAAKAKQENRPFIFFKANADTEPQPVDASRGKGLVVDCINKMINSTNPSQAHANIT